MEEPDGRRSGGSPGRGPRRGPGGRCRDRVVFVRTRPDGRSSHRTVRTSASQVSSRRWDRVRTGPRCRWSARGGPGRCAGAPGSGRRGAARRQSAGPGRRGRRGPGERGVVHEIRANRCGRRPRRRRGRPRTRSVNRQPRPRPGLARGSRPRPRRRGRSHGEAALVAPSERQHVDRLPVTRRRRLVVDRRWSGSARGLMGAAWGSWPSTCAPAPTSMPSEVATPFVGGVDAGDHGVGVVLGDPPQPARRPPTGSCRARGPCWRRGGHGRLRGERDRTSARGRRSPPCATGLRPGSGGQRQQAPAAALAWPRAAETVRSSPRVHRLPRSPPPAQVPHGFSRDVGCGHDVVGRQADEQLAGDAVAPAVLLGSVRAHVAAADAGGPRPHEVEVVVEGDGPLDGDERERRLVVLHAQRRPPGAAEVAALHRVVAGVEHDRTVVVDVEPDRRGMRTPVGPHRGQDPRPNRAPQERLRLVRAHRVVRHDPILLRRPPRHGVRATRRGDGSRGRL